ncbi:hypothetical protein SCHPADRAFT_892947, partial [Schizopora paradoxa]
LTAIDGRSATLHFAAKREDGLFMPIIQQWRRHASVTEKKVQPSCKSTIMDSKYTGQLAWLPITQKIIALVGWGVTPSQHAADTLEEGSREDWEYSPSYTRMHICLEIRVRSVPAHEKMDSSALISIRCGVSVTVLEYLFCSPGTKGARNWTLTSLIKFPNSPICGFEGPAIKSLRAVLLFDVSLEGRGSWPFLCSPRQFFENIWKLSTLKDRGE